MTYVRKTARLAASHLSRMKRFLLAVFALLLAADLVVIGGAFIRYGREEVLSFQSILAFRVLPACFYVAYGVLLIGLLAHFLRLSAKPGGLFALRSLPMGAAGLLWSILLAVLAAILLLWAAQLLALYAGYGLYRLAAMCSAAAWEPPANDLYLAFVRTPFLQFFYPRHPVFWLLAGLMAALPAVVCAYLTVSLCERRTGAFLLASAALGGLAAGMVLGQNAIWEGAPLRGVLAALCAFEVSCLVFMGLMAWRRLRRSRLG